MSRYIGISEEYYGSEGVLLFAKYVASNDDAISHKASHTRFWLYLWMPLSFV
jgi:hypothetical protein